MSSPNTSKRTSSRLGDILKSLTGKSPNTSPSQYSVPKQYAIQLLNKFDLLATKHTKQGWTKQIWNALKYWVSTRVIPEKTDEETRQDLKEIYDTLRPMFEQAQIADELKNNPTEPTLNEKIKSLPRYKELAKLL